MRNRVRNVLRILIKFREHKHRIGKRSNRKPVQNRNSHRTTAKPRSVTAYHHTNRLKIIDGSRSNRCDINGKWSKVLGDPIPHLLYPTQFFRAEVRTVRVQRIRRSIDRIAVVPVRMGLNMAIKIEVNVHRSIRQAVQNGNNQSGYNSLLQHIHRRRTPHY